MSWRKWIEFVSAFTSAHTAKLSIIISITMDLRIEESLSLPTVLTLCVMQPLKKPLMVITPSDISVRMPVLETFIQPSFLWFQ